MNRDSEKLNSYVAKFQTYAKKNPKKAHIHYCIGCFHMELGKYKEAQDNFEKAISISRGYTRAKVGLIVVHIFRRKFLEAVKLYSKYYDDINAKRLYRTKLLRGVSEFYHKDDFLSKKSKETSSPLFFKQVIQPLLAKYSQDRNNEVIILILAMYYMGMNERSLDIMHIFKVCVYIDGIDDNMRWALLLAIADCGEKLYYDLDIASKFTTIPEQDCTDEYVKTIFGGVVLGRNKFKVKSIYNSMIKSGRKISLNMMWKYVDWSWNVNLFDLTVYECCSNLLLAGWVDVLVLEMMAKLEKDKVVELKDEERKMLSIYGYCS